MSPIKFEINDMPSLKRPAPIPPPDLIRMDEGRVNIGAQEELIARIVADAKDGLGGTVFTLNLDHLVKLNDESSFRAAYQRASYVSADGAPVVTMAKELGTPLERVTGADLVLPLCRAAASAGVAVHFFGTSDEIRDRAARRIMR
jgi:UDP-N-acetyl-D-mannosaminuronic acid transferase (WecB/TagA/CpsF family)